MGISGFFGKTNLEKISIEISLPDEIYAIRENYAKIIFHNHKKYLPSFLIRTNIQNNPTLCTYIPAKGMTSIEIPLIFNTRGINIISNIEIFSRFPFNFFIRKKIVPVDIRLLIYPAPIKGIQLLSQMKGNISNDGNILEHTNSREELNNIRGYIQGDTIQNIFWKGYAKTERLMTKEYTGSGNSAIIINFDALIPEGIEKAVSISTYLILHYYKNCTPVGIKLSENIFQPEHSLSNKRQLLRKMALYGKD